MTLPIRVMPRARVPVVGTPSDPELVRRVVEGDSWAREALYRKYFGAVSNTALRLLGNRADAEDVVQDTFITAFHDLHALRDPGVLGAWLLRITVNQVQRRYRRRRLLRSLGLDKSVDDGTLELLACEAITPELRTELAQLDRLLSSIPTAQRIAWILRRVEGHSLEEVAGACDCSLATAKRRIRAADEQIHRYIDFDGGDDA